LQIRGFVTNGSVREGFVLGPQGQLDAIRDHVHGTGMIDASIDLIGARLIGGATGWLGKQWGTMFGREVTEVVAAKTSSNILLNTSKQLQAKFKHAADFGVVGNYSKANAAKFSSALNQHINAPGTQIIQGAYRNANNPVTFYLNPQTGLNVIASPSGQFISGAALSPAQIQGILTKGFLW